MKHLVIDGRNNLYRMTFACLAQGNEEIIESVIKSVVSFISLFKPDKVHVAWDHNGPNWRKHMYPPYKDRATHRTKWVDRYGVDVVKLINKISPVIEDGIGLLGTRKYLYKYQEADDLIYSLCSDLSNEEVIVISSDKDMVQVLEFDDTKLYDPLRSKFMQKPEACMILMKCLEGDKSDNISGFKGIGPVKAKQLALSEEKLKEFLDAGDGSRRDYFDLYKKIIDLSLNPFVEFNAKYVHNVLMEEVNRYKHTEFQKFIREHKLNMLTDLPKIKKHCSELS